MPHTWQLAGPGFAFVWKASIGQDLLRLSLHFLLRQTLQTGIEPDVLFYCQPEIPQAKQEWIIIHRTDLHNLDIN